jgi:hypothetical protein
MAMIALPAAAEIEFSTSTNKTYRAGLNGLLFTGGTFDVSLRDGNGVYASGCRRAFYWSPNTRDSCPLGATGFLRYGNLDDEEVGAASYYSIISVIPAVVIEPRTPLAARLISAPASKLPRPSGGFGDRSYGLNYNLHANSVSEYNISIYEKTESYSADQRSKFESEIVKGVYQYVFPRLKQPTVPASLNTTIYQMAEGTAKINNQVTGFDFAKTLKNKLIQPNNPDGLPAGFVEFSQSMPTTVNWQGLTPSNVLANVDKLHISIRRMVDPLNPSSTTLDLIDDASGSPAAIFPPYLTGREPRVLLTSPYNTSFVFAPILRGGSRGMLQLELSRTFKTGNVTYDFSNRKFEIPILVVNRYTDYALRSGITKAKIADDTDGDGFDNMTEWILDSNARFAGSIPAIEAPMNHRIEFSTRGIKEKQYYGFQIDKKLLTIPAVQYTLQRSFDGGGTWHNFVSDAKWNVFTQVYSPGQSPVLDETDTAGRERIRVESKYDSDGKIYNPALRDSITQGPPPDIQNESYRVLITK